MIHLQPVEGSSRLLCCFKSSIMLPAGDSLTNDPARVTCSTDVDYKDFEKVLTAPMDRHIALAEKIKRAIWELLVARKLDSAFQLKPEDRRNFLEDFGQKVRKIEDEDDGKDTLLTIRKEQVKQLKQIGKAYRDRSRELEAMLTLIVAANPEYRLEEIPKSCGACGTPNASCDMDCATAASMAQHNAVIRKAKKLLEQSEPSL